ncbi:MAG: ABC transporter permease [Pseudobdellovibrionaceae bacterium]
MLVWVFFKKYLFSPRAGALVRKISWLCIIGVAVGVSALVIIMSIMKGLNKQIHQRILSMEPHLVVSPAAGTKKTITDIENSEVMDFLQNEGNRVYAFESQDVIVRTNEGLFRGALARGVSEESLRFVLKEAERLNDKNSSRDSAFSEALAATTPPGENEILIGVDLARSLNVLEGETIVIIPPESLLLPANEIPLMERVGIARILSTNLAEIDAQVIYYVRGKSLTRFNTTASRRIGFEVWIPEPMKAGELKDQLATFKDYEAQTWFDRNSALLLALRLERFVMGTFLALAALISSFSIVTVLSLLISQKRKEMGILMCMGLSRLQIQKLFSNIGFMLALIGLGAGLALGLGVSLYIEFNPLRIVPDVYYDSEIPAQVDYWLVLGVCVVGGLIAWASCYFPTKTVLNLQPSEALRVKN